MATNQNPAKSSAKRSHSRKERPAADVNAAQERRILSFVRQNGPLIVGSLASEAANLGQPHRYTDMAQYITLAEQFGQLCGITNWRGSSSSNLPIGNVEAQTQAAAPLTMSARAGG